MFDIQPTIRLCVNSAIETYYFYHVLTHALRKRSITSCEGT
jgi:hypothetical protein